MTVFVYVALLSFKLQCELLKKTFTFLKTLFSINIFIEYGTSRAPLLTVQWCDFYIFSALVLNTSEERVIDYLIEIYTVYKRILQIIDVQYSSPFSYFLKSYKSELHIQYSVLYKPVIQLSLKLIPDRKSPDQDINCCHRQLLLVIMKTS